MPSASYIVMIDSHMAEKYFEKAIFRMHLILMLNIAQFLRTPI